jgi:hypothetical protein
MLKTVNAAILSAVLILAGCGGGAPKTTGTVSGSSAPGVDASSQAYQRGVKSGTNGNAESDAFSGANFTEACHYGYAYDTSSSLPDYTGQEYQDYLAGCLYALNRQSAIGKHP